MKQRTYLLWVSVAVVSLGCATAQTAQANQNPTFEKANQEYSEGHFQAAVGGPRLANYSCDRYSRGCGFRPLFAGNRQQRPIPRDRDWKKNRSATCNGGQFEQHFGPAARQ